MEGILIGCGQITWSRDMPEEQVLAEIAQAGYAGAPAGPGGNRTPQQLTADFERYGLKPAPGYFGADFWKQERREGLLEQARQQATFARELGLTELYVAPGGFDYVGRSGRSRRQAAGHVRPDDGLTDEEMRVFGETLNQVGEITLREGVLSCFHNHVGTVIETLDEIERLLGLVDPQVIFLGPDTGHLAWAGVDVVAFCRRYADRIKTMHVKDIDPAVLEQGRAQEWDYGTFSKHGIFTELGEGFVDFPTIFDILRSASFQGWLIAETDVTQKPTALESATISRNYLRSIGL
jgi:inosose dehydratase